MRLTDQGYDPFDIEQKTGRSRETIVRTVKQHTGVPFGKYQKTNGRSIRQDDIPVLSYSVWDPRSFHCQKLRVCYHSRCHMHHCCPANPQNANGKDSPNEMV